MMLSDMPDEELPRERLMRCGARALKTNELLAILLHTGNQEENVLTVADKVLSLYQDIGLLGVRDMTVEDFREIKGVGPAKATAILAAVELGFRMFESKAQSIKTISCAEDAADYVSPKLRYQDHESFCVMLLDTHNHIRAFKVLTSGTLAASVAHPRDVFRTAVRYDAASVILVHNHPSGDPTPSRQDIAMTRNMIQAGKIMHIEVLDHIIIGGDDYCSLNDAGYFT